MHYQLKIDNNKPETKQPLADKAKIVQNNSVMAIPTLQIINLPQLPKLRIKHAFNQKIFPLHVPINMRSQVKIPAYPGEETGSPFFSSNNH